MASISDLTPAELLAVNISRSERGLGPLGNPLQIQASAAPYLRSIVAQEGGLPGAGGETTYEIRIKNVSTSLQESPPGTIPQTPPGMPKPGSPAPRWTEPSPTPPPATPAPVPSSQLTGQTAFDCGIQNERRRQAFADRVRIAVARRLQNRAQGSRDATAVALLEAEEAQFMVEAALPPMRATELSEEQRAFADAVNRKLAQVLRPEARRL
jgi:hypothetical protein